MAKQDPSARRLGTMNKRSADPSAKRLGTYQIPKGKPPGRRLSKANVMADLKKIGTALLPTAVRGAGGPTRSIVEFMGGRYQKKPPVGRRVRRSGSGK